MSRRGKLRAHICRRTRTIQCIGRDGARTRFAAANGRRQGSCCHGYADCYWVTSWRKRAFEDPAIAAVMNDHSSTSGRSRGTQTLDSILSIRAVALGSKAAGPLTMFLSRMAAVAGAGTLFPPSLAAWPPRLRDCAACASRTYHDVPRQDRAQRHRATEATRPPRGAAERRRHPSRARRPGRGAPHE